MTRHTPPTLAAVGLLGPLAALLIGACGSTYGYPPSREQRDTTTAPATTEATTEATTDGPQLQLLSAFFGLDNTMPRFANRLLCKGAGGNDGMPIIFSAEIDPSTLQAGDLQVTTASGNTLAVACVTMAPAIDPGELRTALLLGQLGGADDPPVRVDVVGHVLSADGTRTWRGTSAAVTPLAEGPTLIVAEVVSDRKQWRVGHSKSQRGRGDGCPETVEQAAVRQVVRTIWSGGITRPGGDEMGDAEKRAYKVTMQAADGTTTDITPAAVADLGDGDNYHLLCLTQDGTPQSVSFPAGLLTDPNEDRNPATSVPVTGP